MTAAGASSNQPESVEHLLREIAPRVLGAVARRHDDFAAAEDAVQEALIAAAAQWPRTGIPENPRGWLYSVAVRRLADERRGASARRRREEAVAAERMSEPPAMPDDPDAGEDDSLVLLFMCCHPSLSVPSAIALTLRAVGGLTTAEIANAFLVPEATMAQRISRAKQAIKSSRIPFALPDGGERAARLDAVLHVLYLIFSEGYTSSTGSELQRADLSSEGIRLARTLHAMLPDDAEVTGLLALMLLTDARREARTGPSGELIPLDEQDRAQWDRALIDEGVALVAAALSRGTIGPYQLQAAVAALHDEAESAGKTDWAQILALYGLLERMSDSPMVSLSRAIAAAMVWGPTVGLAQVDTLASDPGLKGHYRIDAVRGHLHELEGNHDLAIAHYRAAAERTASTPERNYLLEKAARLAWLSPSPDA